MGDIKVMKDGSLPWSLEEWEAEQRKEKYKMLTKLLKLNPQNYHIIVEDVNTEQKHDLICPLGIFQRVQKWGIGTVMEVDSKNGIVKAVVRQDPLDSKGAYV